jgi:ACS family hexuronate transporter-like MFS transporter
MAVIVSAPTQPRVGNFRWVICGLLFFSVAINYVDRQIIGLLKNPLSQELGWSEGDYANIAAAFQFAYAFGYLFGGRAMDWLGVKRGLPLAVIFWSVACAAHGLVRSVTGFMAARVGLGLAEGGNFPGAIKTVAEWFPVKERALATGIFNCGSNTGAILCPLLVPWMAATWGWQSTFFITGALGIFWLIAWAWLYEVPEKHRLLSATERAYITEGRPPLQEKEPAVPWLSLFKYRATWAYLIAGILAGPIWPFYLFFLPDFLQKRYALSITQVGLPVAVFYLVASFGGVAGGWLCSKLIDRGWTLNSARKVALLACALAALPVFLAPHVSNLWLTVAIVGIAGSAHQGWSANLYTFVSDTVPRQAVSSVVGLGGFVAFITGGFTSKAVGYILTTSGSYTLIFASASLMYVLSLGALHLLVPQIGRK